ncbi:hypothetical protein EV421DRAFT_1306642 [Armillaria borealis]|uniref:Uncharacterized protein n=1 Tax=Armillaria borealis TaxID=47425 RepID=A0AA39MY35_9AGAR|nr:hypothetical protein EV421DRAFT_1306642 [Armillaria borealis]
MGGMGPYSEWDSTLHKVFSHLIKTLRVPASLVEGKAERLIAAIDDVCTEKKQTKPSAEPFKVNPETPRPSEPEPIDVDAIQDAPRLPSPVASNSRTSYTKAIRTRSCPGIKVPLEPGSSAHSSYPFGVHEVNGDPWDYEASKGGLVLRSRTCRRVEYDSKFHECSGCRVLRTDARLEGILGRMKNGVHDNTPLAYHSITGLQDIIRKKQTTIRALRLRKLNDSRKLMTQKRALGLHKEWMLAIGSGKVERVERLVRLGLQRGASVKALLMMCECGEAIEDRNCRDVITCKNDGCETQLVS